MWPFSQKYNYLYYPVMVSFLDLRNRLPRRRLDKLKVCNVGVGEGGSALALQLPYFNFARLDHIDVHQPYLDAARARTWSAKVVNFINTDVRNWNFAAYDYVFMFDVLEHLEKADALAVMEKIKCHQLIFIPLETMFRKNDFGVKAQDHLSFWTEADFKERGYTTEILSGFHIEEKSVFDALWALK